LATGGLASIVTMSEAPAAAPSQRGSQRGRGGRRGRSRRGHHHGPRRSDGPAEGSQTAHTEPAITHSEPIVPSESEDANAQRASQPGRGRRERGRASGGRRGRGTAGQRSIVVSHRGGRGPPPVPVPGAGGSAVPGLNATAAEFVPGQPVPSSRFVVSSQS
jgi:transcriptional repressor NF-X1